MILLNFNFYCLLIIPILQKKCHKNQQNNSFAHIYHNFSFNINTIFLKKKSILNPNEIEIIFETQLISQTNKKGLTPMSKVAEQLKAIKQGNTNLYEHLKKVIVEMSLNNDSVDSFESYSFSQKSQGGPASEYRVSQDFTQLKSYEVKNKTLLGKINAGTEEQPQQPASLGYIPDFMEESRIFEKFGIGFGEDQTYCIFKSLARLSHKKSAKQVKLWGKILASEKDYYIVEGVADSGEDAAELSADTEPKGTGVNKNTYWVTNQLTGEWTELPVVTPSQVQISRKIKYLFTGDLNRKIMTNPLFPGKESHLLKCQIARINTTCTIVPKGMFILNAETAEVESPQEYNFPEISYLSKNENWVYSINSILKNGRTTLIKPQGMQPQDEQKWLKKMNQSDPTQPKLKSIAMDNTLWNVRNHGLSDTYKTAGKVPKIVSKGVVGVKSLLWPGWLTIAYAGKYTSIYVGYGHKFKQNYYPSEPEMVLQEAEDRDEVVIDQ